MSKPLFEVLNKMNHEDAKNGTKNVKISNHFISADKVKQGGKVCMGIDEETLLDIINNPDVISLLVVINKKEYKKCDSDITSQTNK